MRHPRHSVSACPLVLCSGEVLRKERAEKGEIESSPTAPAARLSSLSLVIPRRVLILTARTARSFVLGHPLQRSSRIMDFSRRGQKDSPACTCNRQSLETAQHVCVPFRASSPFRLGDRRN